jgi:hypothetical protein
MPMVYIYRAGETLLFFYVMIKIPDAIKKKETR